MQNQPHPATVIFDNAGGVTLQLRGFAHTYPAGRPAAEDYLNYQAYGDTSDWEGHDRYAANLSPTLEDQQNGGYLVYSEKEITKRLEDRLIDKMGEPSWNNIEEFFSFFTK